MRLAAALTALALLGGCTVAPAPTPSVEPVETTTVSTSAASTVSASASPTPSTSTETASPAGRCAAALVDDMTLRERAGQLVMVGVTTASAAEVKVLKDQKIGSVILMGQHTDEVLRELGVSDAELAQLRASGVIHSGEPVVAGDD